MGYEFCSKPWEDGDIVDIYANGKKNELHYFLNNKKIGKNLIKFRNQKKKFKQGIHKFCWTPYQVGSQTCNNLWLLA